MSTVVQLPIGKALAVRAAANVFLDLLGNPNTVRNYGIGVGKSAERSGRGPAAGGGRARRDGRGSGTAVGQCGGEHVELPSGGGAALARLVP
jgi:hypothetical protein